VCVGRLGSLHITAAAGWAFSLGCSIPARFFSIPQGRYVPEAIRIAANYYDVCSHEVAHYVGQVGGTAAGRR